MLGVHLGEKHPQRLPHGGDGLHEQAPSPPKEQPHPPPLQKTPPPTEQDGLALLHLQEREDQELLGHVSGERVGDRHRITPKAPRLFGLGEGGVGMALSGHPAESFPHPPRNRNPLSRGGHLAVHLLLNPFWHTSVFFHDSLSCFQRTNISREISISAFKQYASTSVLHPLEFLFSRRAHFDFVQVRNVQHDVM